MFSSHISHLSCLASPWDFRFTIQDVNILYFPLSYKSCLPKSHRHDIQSRNRWDRYRIRITLKRFLQRLGNSSVDECSLKLKYLTELAGIVPSLGSEIFKVDPLASHSKSSFSLIRVTGETGIQTGGSDEPESSMVRKKMKLVLSNRLFLTL